MEKILTFIIRDHKVLLLLGSDKDPQFCESFWYVITGGVEDEDKTLDDAVRREVMEETNLELSEIIDLNWKFEYYSLGKHCVEHAFISYAVNDEVRLNEESVDYKWCDINEFLQLVRWFYDKKELKEKIEKYLK